MKKLLVFLFFVLFTAVSAKAQDKIYRKGGTVIKAKVTEIGTEEIKYKDYDNPDGPLYTIDKAKVIKVVYENGRVEIYQGNGGLKDPELYADQLKKAIKVNFLAPQIGYTEILFEKNLKPGTSYELGLAVLGAGRNISLTRVYETNGQYKTIRRNAFGVALSAGYKFNKLPDFLNRGTRYAHVMQGIYAKPTFTIGNYAENQVVDYFTNGMPSIVKRNVTYGALTIQLGKQWVFGDRFLLDFYWGLGYTADNKGRSDNIDLSDFISNNFTSTRIGTGAGLAWEFGIKAGLLIK
jgi:hypothetical protein